MGRRAKAKTAKTPRVGQLAGAAGAAMAALPALQAEALEMRKLGHSYQEIATAQGVSISTAHGRVQAALEELRAVVRVEAEAVREMEDARLDVIVRRLTETVRTGDPDQATRASAQLIRASESRRKLWGADLAKTAPAPAEGGEAPTEELDPARLTNEQLKALEDLLREVAP